MDVVKRAGIALVLLGSIAFVGTLVGAAAPGGVSPGAYPKVAVDQETGLVTPAEVGEVEPCPENGLVPAGSTCQLLAIGNGEYSWHVLEAAEAAPPCERATAPSGTDPSSCTVLRVEPSSVGDSALLAFTASNGDVVRVWVFPGGRQIVFDS